MRRARARVAPFAVALSRAEDGLCHVTVNGVVSVAWGQVSLALQRTLDAKA